LVRGLPLYFRFRKKIKNAVMIAEIEIKKARSMFSRPTKRDELSDGGTKPGLRGGDLFLGLQAADIDGH